MSDYRHDGKIDTPEKIAEFKQLMQASLLRAITDKDYAIKLAVGTGMYNADGTLKDEFS